MANITKRWADMRGVLLLFLQALDLLGEDSLFLLHGLLLLLIHASISCVLSSHALSIHHRRHSGAERGRGCVGAALPNTAFVLEVHTRDQRGGEKASVEADRWSLAIIAGSFLNFFCWQWRWGCTGNTLNVLTTYWLYEEWLHHSSWHQCGGTTMSHTHTHAHAYTLTRRRSVTLSLAVLGCMLVSYKAETESKEQSVKLRADCRCLRALINQNFTVLVTLDWLSLHHYIYTNHSYVAIQQTRMSDLKIN